MTTGRVCFLIIGTNKYYSLAKNCERSIKEFVKFSNHTTETLIFTNEPKDGELFAPSLPWPLITMCRFHFFLNYKDLLNQYDYIYYSDADMEVQTQIGDEILSDLVLTSHPGFPQLGSGTYERNYKSKAYVSDAESYNKHYFIGSFQGGAKNRYLDLCQSCKSMITEDLKWNHVQLWHDESAMNRYAISNPPTLILHPGFSYPDGWNIPFPKIIRAVAKNQDEIRKV